MPEAGLHNRSAITFEVHDDGPHVLLTVSPRSDERQRAMQAAQVLPVLPPWLAAKVRRDNGRSR